MKPSQPTRTRLIRNSTAEFLIFTGQAGEQSIEARYEDETVWLSQKLMATLFDVEVPTVNEHLKNIFSSGELDRKATLRKFRTVQTEGSREVERSIDFYNLDAIISVGYRVNSKRATQFRQWATQVLKEFAVKGYVLDRKRLENGTFLDGCHVSQSSQSRSGARDRTARAGVEWATCILRSGSFRQRSRFASPFRVARTVPSKCKARSLNLEIRPPERANTTT
jgi:hypothetical protein